MNEIITQSTHTQSTHTQTLTENFFSKQQQKFLRYKQTDTSY